MIIQDLKPSNHVQGRWLAMMEDGSILRVGESEVLEFSLYKGKELGQEEAQRLLECTRQSGLKEKALELLSRKPMSRKELEHRLEQWEAGEEETARICERMEELGFLDDSRYAAMVVRHYSRKGYGSRKLRDELYRRGVPRQFWDEAMEECEESTAAIDAFLEKKLKGSTEAKDLKRAADALARRGYSWNEISEGLRRLGAPVEE